jgi:hypothetical protein
LKLPPLGKDRGGDVFIAMGKAVERRRGRRHPVPWGAASRFALPCEGAQMQVACPSLNGQGDGWRERHTA